MSPRKLASELGAGLAAAAPHEVDVSVVGGTIRIRKRGTPWGMDADMPRFLDVPSALPELLWGVLDQVQDEIAETVAEPWPAVAPAVMPEPFVEIRDGQVIAGYGDPAEPVLELLAIPLDDLS